MLVRYLKSIHFIINFVLLIVIGITCMINSTWAVFGIILISVQFFRILLDILFLVDSDSALILRPFVSRKAKKLYDSGSER